MQAFCYFISIVAALAFVGSFWLLLNWVIKCPIAAEWKRINK